LQRVTVKLQRFWQFRQEIVNWKIKG